MFPGSGEEEMLCVLERLISGVTNSSWMEIPLDSGSKGASGVSFHSNEKHAKSTSMISKHSDNTALQSVPKGIPLVRDTLEAIWTRDPGSPKLARP
jgi:hypothetical protein